MRYLSANTSYKISMRYELDARGMLCPKPVLEAKKIIETSENGDVLKVNVDNQIAVSNLEKMASQLNLGFAYAQIDAQHFEVMLEVREKVESIVKAVGKSVVVISSDKMGEEEALGEILIKGFIYALSEKTQEIDKVIFYNRGVLLTKTSSSVIEDLKTLEDKGVDLMVCGTCLNYFGIEPELGVGRVTNMYDILESQLRAERVLKP